MTTIARTDYRAEVARLLDRIADESHALTRLKVAGVRKAGLADRKRELAADRERLAELVSRRAA